MTRILIAFGSKRGGTAGLARMIGEALTEAGYQVQRPRHPAGPSLSG